MFKSKNVQQIESDRLKQIELEKQELLFIKKQLEDNTPKIDVSNVYVWENKGLYSIVRLEIRKYRGRALSGYGREINGYESKLIDIFSTNLIYQKNAIKIIERNEFMSGESQYDGYFAPLYSLYEVDKNILAYADKKVPLYVLQQLYYKLNDVDIDAVLRKEK